MTKAVHMEPVPETPSKAYLFVLDAKDFSVGEDAASQAETVKDEDFSVGEDAATAAETAKDLGVPKRRYSVWEDLLDDNEHDADSTNDVHSSPDFWEEMFNGPDDTEPAAAAKVMPSHENPYVGGTMGAWGK